MSQGAPNASPNIFPFLRYRDAPTAIEWLATAFGFEKRMVVPGPAGTIGHAELSLGPGTIMLGSAKDDDRGTTSPRNLDAVNHGVYIALDDIDAHYERAKAAGAEIVRELEATDYGSRDYAARDIEGHVWYFGTYRPAA